MDQWLEQTVKKLVNHPEAVSIEQSRGEITVVHRVAVAREDSQIFNEKNARLTRALNAVVGLTGMRERVRHIVKIQAQPAA
jgi:predicted RNA-binding protein YlqC (UPF0109 family)